jgi:hypothetical protein
VIQHRVFGHALQSSDIIGAACVALKDLQVQCEERSSEVRGEAQPIAHHLKQSYYDTFDTDIYFDQITFQNHSAYRIFFDIDELMTSPRKTDGYLPDPSNTSTGRDVLEQAAIVHLTALCHSTGWFHGNRGSLPAAFTCTP